MSAHPAARPSLPPLRHEGHDPAAWPRDVFAVAGITGVFCISLLLMIMLATGPTGSDDISYFRGATEILRNGWVPEVHHHLGRKVFILLVAVPAALGGHIIFGSLVNILYSALLDVAVAAFVSRQFGPKPAFVAMTFTGLNGVALLWSGTLIPDTTVSVFMFLSVVALYYALLPDSPRPVMSVVLSGALAGLSYAVKEPGILLAPPAIVSIFLLRPDLRAAERVTWSAVYAGAFGCIFAAEGMLQLWLSGDFLYRYHALNAVHNLGNQPVPPLEFIRRVYWSVASIATQYRNILLIPAIAGTIAWLAGIFNRSAASVFAVTGVFVGGYLIFGTTSFPELRPMPFQPRYLAPLFPLMAVSLAALFSKLDSIRNRLIPLAWSALLLAFVVTSISDAVAEAGDLGRARYFKNVAAALEGLLAHTSDAPIMVDPSTLEMLVHFMPHKDLARLKPIPSDENLPRGLYLVDPYQDSIVRLGPAPHFSEIMALPVVATINLNPLLVSRYFPDFRADAFGADPLMTAVIREKR